MRPQPIAENGQKERYSTTDIGALAKQFESGMMDAAELEFLAQNMLESFRGGEELRGVCDQQTSSTSNSQRHRFSIH
jgi:hypothetical protein